MSEFKDMFKETAAEESGGFTLIEQGEYEAELVDCKLDMTKSPERLTFVYELTEGENQGKKLFANYQLEGRGIGFLKKDLTILGLDFSEIGSPEDIAQLVWDAMPMPVIVFVNQKEWQGKMYNNTYLNALNDKPAALSTPKAPTNQKEADRQASQKANGKSAQRSAPPSGKSPVRGKPATKTPPKRTPAGEPDFGDSDDIPF